MKKSQKDLKNIIDYITEIEKSITSVPIKKRKTTKRKTTKTSVGDLKPTKIIRKKTSSNDSKTKPKKIVKESKTIKKGGNKTIEKTVDVFTDGSHRKRKSGSLCGYGVYFPDGSYENIGKSFTILPKTNQRAELYAIYQAIKTITESDNKININIYTDSRYSMDIFTKWIKNWKKNNWIASTGQIVLNQDIIKDVDELINNHKGKIYFIHVKAHTGGKDYYSLNNQKADDLAKSGALNNLI